MSEFLELEAQDGIRMTWNVIPGTKQDAASCVVPVSALYTPLYPNPAIPVLPYAPLRCRICRSILNSFSVSTLIPKFGNAHSAFSATTFPSTTLLFRQATYLPNCILNVLLLSTWPLPKQAPYHHQSSFLLLILA